MCRFIVRLQSITVNVLWPSLDLIKTSSRHGDFEGSIILALNSFWVSLGMNVSSCAECYGDFVAVDRKLRVRCSSEDWNHVRCNKTTDERLGFVAFEKLLHPFVLLREIVSEKEIGAVLVPGSLTCSQVVPFYVIVTWRCSGVTLVKDVVTIALRLRDGSILRYCF